MEIGGSDKKMKILGRRAYRPEKFGRGVCCRGRGFRSSCGNSHYRCSSWRCAWTDALPVSPANSRQDVAAILISRDSTTLRSVHKWCSHKRKNFDPNHCPHVSTNLQVISRHFRTFLANLQISSLNPHCFLIPIHACPLGTLSSLSSYTSFVDDPLTVCSIS